LLLLLQLSSLPNEVLVQYCSMLTSSSHWQNCKGFAGVMLPGYQKLIVVGWQGWVQQAWFCKLYCHYASVLQRQKSV